MEKKRARTENTEARNESLSNIGKEKEPVRVHSMENSASTSNQASKTKRGVPSGFQKRKKAKSKQLAKEIEGTRPITGFLVS